ncbi:GAF and ANTAR domain-containing protein [Lentzea sp. HUAS TT2]|uniref:GAF and ANTAR domain-containing protein n=1 Tax=Lentzea sp. HUAS TT2 TaxID=3447454 RepID=UPI003F7279B8
MSASGAQPEGNEPWMLLRLLSAVVGDPHRAPDLHTASKAVVEAAVSDLDGAEHASVMLPGEKSAAAASGPLAAALGDLQHGAAAGPSFDALHGRVVHGGDLASETRWGEFAAAAVEHGIRSVWASPLCVDGAVCGSLTLYSSQLGAFPAGREQDAHLFACHAAIAIAGAQHKARIRQAIEARDAIGMAKGILMERHDLDSAEAFQLIVKASQRSNVKLRELSDRIVATRRQA